MNELNTLFDEIPFERTIGKFILGVSNLSGIGGDSSFLVHHYIANNLKANKNSSSYNVVCLIATDQSFFHYSTIQKKLGINLNLEASNNRFYFINILNPYKWNNINENNSNESSNQQSINQFAISLSQNWEFKLFKLLQDIFNKQIKFNNKSPSYTLIFDNLNLFFNFLVLSEKPFLSTPTSEFQSKQTKFYQFLHYCYLLIQESHGNMISIIENLSSQVIFGNEKKEDCIEDERILYNMIKEKADICISCNPLSTGYSKEIHGQITIEIKTNPSQDPLKFQSKSYHYKTLDNNIKLFSVGSKDSL